MSILHNKLYISNECMKSFGGFHSSFKVSSIVVVLDNTQYCS